MSIRDKIIGNKDAVRAYKTAKTELARVADRDRDESDDFVDANDRVVKAAKNVPWTRR